MANNLANINIYKFCLYTSLLKPCSATEWENPKCSVFTRETTWRYGFLPTRIFAQTFSKNKVHKKEQQKSQQVSKFQYPTWTAYRLMCYVSLQDLHSTQHTCAWGATRLVNHTSFNIVHASIPKLWASLSLCEIQDGCQTAQPTDHLTHPSMGGHKTTSPCNFVVQIFMLTWPFGLCWVGGGVIQHGEICQNHF